MQLTDATQVCKSTVHENAHMAWDQLRNCHDSRLMQPAERSEKKNDKNNDNKNMPHNMLRVGN